MGCNWPYSVRGKLHLNQKGRQTRSARASASTIMTETVLVPGVNLALEPKSHDFDLLPCNVTHSMLCVLQVYCLTGTQIWMH